MPPIGTKRSNPANAPWSRTRPFGWLAAAGLSVIKTEHVGAKNGRCHFGKREEAKRCSAPEHSRVFLTKVRFLAGG